MENVGVRVHGADVGESVARLDDGPLPSSRKGKRQAGQKPTSILFEVIEILFSIDGNVCAVIGTTNKQPVMILHTVDAEVVVRIVSIFVKGFRQGSEGYVNLVYV